MVGKAYRVPSSLDRLRKQQKQIKELQGIHRSRNTPKPVASTAFAGISAAGDTGGVGNFLDPAGDTMIGPLALAPPVDFSVDIDADGILDIGESSSNSQYSSNIQIEDVPTSTTLDTIAGAAFDGQILVIRTFAPGSITIAQATFGNGGNIQTPNDTNFTMGNLEMISLVFDASLIIFDNAPGGTWRVLTGDATGGGGGLTEPVIFGINTLTPLTLPTTTTIAWDTKNPQQITLDRAIEFDFINLPANGSYEGILVIIDIDATGGFDSPIWPASLTNPPVIPTTALSRFSVMLYTIDNGTTVTHATSVGSSTGGGALLSNVVIDVNKNWLNFSISNLGGLTMSGDIDVSTFDVLNIDRATFADDLSSITANNIAQMVLNSSGSFQTNVDTGDNFVWTILNDTILTVQENVSNDSVLTLQSLDETGGAVVNVFRNDIDGGVPSPLVIGSYSFQTGTTAASDVGDYATIQGVAEDVASGAIEGSMDLLAADGGGAQSVFISINDGANNLVDIFKVLDMNANDILMGTGANITAGGAGEGMTNIGHLDFTDNFATPTALLSLYSDGTDLLANTGGGVVNLSNIGAVGANTTLSNLTSPTAINQILNMGTNSITFDPSTVLIGSPSSNILNIQFPTSGELRLLFNAVQEWGFTSTDLSGPNIILSNTLVINDSSTDPVANGIFSRNGSNLGLQIPQFTIQNETLTGSDVAELSLLKIDTGSAANDGVAEINFSVFDSPTTTNYARIKAQIIDQNAAGILFFGVRADGVNNITAMQIQGSPTVSARTFIEFNSSARIGSNMQFAVPTGSSDLQIRPAVNNLGFTVSTETLVVGGFGSMKMPVDTGTSGTAAAADTDFGDVTGCYGLYLESGGIPTFVIKIDDSPTTWATLTLSASGNIGAGRLT